MLLTMLKSKIHRLVVTDANLDYEGSFTLDEDLMDAAGLLAFERIDVLDVTNGSRITTYVIPGERGSGVACANGAAAHAVHRGDVAILVSYVELAPEEAARHEPRIVMVDERNRERTPVALGERASDRGAR